MAFACIPASTAKPRGCRRRRRHREQLRRGLLNTDPGSAALKPAAMARPQVGSTPEVATAAAGSASRLLYKYKRLLTALGPQRVVCHERTVCVQRRGTVREMKEGPSRPAVRCRSQATASCCRQERWWRCVKKVRERHAVREMKADPSEPSCRGRLQTAMSCFGQKLR